MNEENKTNAPVQDSVEVVEVVPAEKEKEKEEEEEEELLSPWHQGRGKGLRTSPIHKWILDARQRIPAEFRAVFDVEADPDFYHMTPAEKLDISNEIAQVLAATNNKTAKHIDLETYNHAINFVNQSLAITEAKNFTFGAKMMARLYTKVLQNQFELCGDGKNVEESEKLFNLIIKYQNNLITTRNINRIKTPFGPKNMGRKFSDPTA